MPSQHIAVLLVAVVALWPATVGAQHLFGPRLFHIGSGKLGKFGPFGYGHLANARIGHIGKLNYGQIGGLYGNSFVGAANPFPDDGGDSSNVPMQQLQAPPMDANNGWESNQWQQPAMVPPAPPPPMLGQPNGNEMWMDPNNQPQLWQEPLQDTAQFRQQFEPVDQPPLPQQQQLSAPMWNMQSQLQQPIDEHAWSNRAVQPLGPIDDNRPQTMYSSDENGIGAPMMYY